MKRLLLRAHKLWKNAGQYPPQIENATLLRQIYLRIVETALKDYESMPELKPKGKEKRGKTKRRAGHNLALRLQKRQDDVLRFLFDRAWISSSGFLPCLRAVEKNPYKAAKFFAPFSDLKPPLIFCFTFVMLRIPLRLVVGKGRACVK